jgi:hypothetical protein
MSRRILLFLVAPALLLAGCNARKDFPEPNAGWHSASYGTVFGTLRRIPGRTDQDKPTWVIVFGDPKDTYQGIFALTEAPIGYAGGEQVEIRGHLLSAPTTDSFNGRWYVVESIQLWTSYRAM